MTKQVGSCLGTPVSTPKRQKTKPNSNHLQHYLTNFEINYLSYSQNRFWFENPSVFTPAQLEQLKRVTLSRILCDNGDNISQITTNVFLLPHLQSPKFVSCSNIPKMDFKKWQNCGAGNITNITSRKLLTKYRSWGINLVTSSQLLLSTTNFFLITFPSLKNCRGTIYIVDQNRIL